MCSPSRWYFVSHGCFVIPVWQVVCCLPWLAYDALPPPPSALQTHNAGLCLIMIVIQFAALTWWVPKGLTFEQLSTLEAVVWLGESHLAARSPLLQWHLGYDTAFLPHSHALQARRKTQV